MISHLSGELLDCADEALVLDVNGVGYEVAVPLSTAETLSVGSKIQLWIYTAVREDAISLFGFLHKVEKALFLSLISVNGIGPKVALKMMSGATPDRLSKMIEEGDVRGLTQLPKIGKKTAEQIILSLRGKLPALTGLVSASSTPARTDSLEHILSALVNLGFKEPLAARAVEALPPQITVEEGVRRCLAALTAN
jgi:Holliday junction DNA helicase RuvA